MQVLGGGGGGVTPFEACGDFLKLPLGLGFGFKGSRSRALGFRMSE